VKPTARKKGKVESFDQEVGLGEVRSDDGELYPFHCTQIADGSRTIASGAEVEFVVGPGHRGTWEARSLATA
jgi:cold shock CspA family protein